MYMLHDLLMKILVSAIALVYPGYASYKALSETPVAQAELERWLMYWSVLGFMGGFESVAEWFIQWIPFYYTLKITFLLYLVLPQIRGSAYVYGTHLLPYLRQHELKIDAFITRYKALLTKCLTDYVRAVGNLIAVTLGQHGGANEQNGFQAAVSATISALNKLLKMYGPTVLAAGSVAGKYLSEVIKAWAEKVAQEAEAAIKEQQEASTAAPPPPAPAPEVPPVQNEATFPPFDFNVNPFPVPFVPVAVPEPAPEPPVHPVPVPAYPAAAAPIFTKEQLDLLAKNYPQYQFLFPQAPVAHADAAGSSTKANASKSHPDLPSSVPSPHATSFPSLLPLLPTWGVPPATS